MRKTWLVCCKSWVNNVAQLRALSALLIVGIGSTSVALAQDGNASAGAVKAGQCAGCHGIAGWRNAYPAYRVPKLGGQQAQYLAAALKAYQTKARAHPGMQGIAASLSDQDIADLAAFLSNPKP